MTCGAAEGAEQVLLSAPFAWAHCAVSFPCSQFLLPVLPANSSGKGWALLLLSWRLPGFAGSLERDSNGAQAQFSKGV